MFANGSILTKKPVTLREIRSTRPSFSRGSSDGENIDYDKTVDTFDISSDEMDESRLRNGKVYRRQVISVYLIQFQLVKLLKKNF